MIRLKYRKIVFIFCIILCLGLVKPLFARQVRMPNSFFEKCLDQLTNFTIEETQRDAFFQDNWEILNAGIQINFDTGVFLEIRRTDKDVIVQLFGKLSPTEEQQLSILRSNLRYEAHKHGISEEFADLSYVDLANYSRGMYSILNLSDEDFGIIVDILIKGGSSNITPESEHILELVDSMGEVIEEVVEKGRELEAEVGDGGLYSGKGSLIKTFNFAYRRIVERLQGIKYEVVIIPSPRERSRTIEFLESLRDEIKMFVDALSEPYGDLIYRILYHRHLKHLLEDRVESTVGEQ